MVSNSAGYDSANTFVFISPYFTTQLEDREGYNRSTLTLIREAAAFPAPQYQRLHNTCGHEWMVQLSEMQC